MAFWSIQVLLYAQAPSRHIQLLPIYFQPQSDMPLEKVAEKYGVSTHQLKSWNRLTGDGMIPAQTRLVAAFIVEKRKRSKPVFTSDRTVVTDFGTFDRIYHQVESQEYLLDIAEAYDANIHQLQEWNGFQLRDVNVIIPGQQVLVGFEFMADRPATQLKPIVPEKAEGENQAKPAEPIKEAYIPFWVWIVMGVLGVGIIGLITFIILNKKEKKEEEQDEEDEEYYDEDDEEEYGEEEDDDEEYEEDDDDENNRY